jgi:hypothetical protein
LSTNIFTKLLGGENGLEKIKAPSWEARGLHSEGLGGGRGLTAWDAVCVDSIIAI